MTDSMKTKWYAVPAYRGAPSPSGSPHIVDEAGQLICTCEYLEHAEHIAAMHNHHLWTQEQETE